ncbi:hypothetical protein Dimus_029033, partial [Dionaea muscipula]
MVPECRAGRIFVHGAGLMEAWAWSSPLPAQAPLATHNLLDTHAVGRAYRWPRMALTVHVAGRGCWPHMARGKLHAAGHAWLAGSSPPPRDGYV